MLRFSAGLLVSLFLLIPFSCTESTEKSGVSKAFMRTSRGDVGELLLVMDSAKWNGKLGVLLRKMLEAPVEGLINDEAMYDVRWVDPMKMNDLLRIHHTQIYVTSLESKSMATQRLKGMYSKESIKKLSENDKTFRINLSDQYAKPQLVMQLFGRNDAELLRNLQEKPEYVLDPLATHMRKQQQINTYEGKNSVGIEKTLKENYNFTLRVPFGYDLSRHGQEADTAHAWVRRVSSDEDYNLFLYREPYVNQQQADTAHIHRLLEHVGRKYLYDKDRPSLYITREPLVPTSFKRVDFKGRYAWEARGWWETSRPAMGGAYLAYLVLDEETNTVNFLFGFLYAPNKAKRRRLQELETILWTIEP
jgi:hypothetical protein